MAAGGIDTLDVIQIVLMILIGFFVANYVYLRWSMRVTRSALTDGIEGFMNPEGPDGDTVVLGNEHLYDEFYAKVYDQIVDGSTRQDAETGLTLAWAKGFRPELRTLQVLDIGCGTGGQVALFKKAGVGKAVGLDASDAMISTARRTHPKGDYRVGNAEQVGQFAAGEFNLATMYYFTYYYLRDAEQALKNAFYWLEPGGCLVIHLVNREKFDPILESASPFVAFSVQKYAKERVTRSAVEFDKFSYSADFQHEGENGEFREEFKFKNGKLRRQVHTLRMPRMEEVVAKAEACGFVYKQFIDLTAIGYEYQYLFCFVR
jgi:ubiquinone/menaquinone biosynthesis C-methylase UbiE